MSACFFCFVLAWFCFLIYWKFVLGEDFGKADGYSEGSRSEGRKRTRIEGNEKKNISRFDLPVLTIKYTLIYHGRRVG